jgi:glycosyltransferase involved in cell wall biosynthesis
MPGAIYGQGYKELGTWCFAYIHATEVGGTHPALIEAMGRGALVIYRAVPENVEVCGDAGLQFVDDASLVAAIRTALAMPETERNEYRRRARDRVRTRYCWEAVTNQYEELFQVLRM